MEKVKFKVSMIKDDVKLLDEMVAASGFSRSVILTMCFHRTRQRIKLSFGKSEPVKLSAQEEAEASYHEFLRVSQGD